MNHRHNLEKHKKCPYCEFKSLERRKLHIHIDNNHSEREDKNFLCEKCNKSFIYQFTYDDHSKYKCKYSEYYQSTEKQRKEKSQRQYAKKRIILNCDYCDKVIKTSTSLVIKKHYEINHPGKPLIAE